MINHLTRIILFALAVLSVSCQEQNRAQFIDLVDEPCNQVLFGIKEMNLVESDAFRINYPEDWVYSIESDSVHTTYVFSEQIDTINTLELTDEEFDKYYSNFQTISITYDILYPTLNYVKEIENVHQMISDNIDQQIIQTGTSTLNNKQAAWIKYRDDSYNEDNLVCESITTCILGSNHYIWILIQTFGDHKKDLRKCKGMEIIKTLEIKV